MSADFFRLFGASVAQGRTFTDAEARWGGDHVAIVSDRFWRSRLGGATGVIGQTLSLDSDRFTIVGVLDASFDMDPIKPSLAASPAIWLPLQLDPASTNDLNYILVAGRLRPGVSFATAQEQTARSARAVRRTLPSVMPVDHGLSLEWLQAVVVRDVRPSLLLLWSIVAVVLFIACANTINLLLVRASVRRREIAVRVATGASQGRITRSEYFDVLKIPLVRGRGFNDRDRAGAAPVALINQAMAKRYWPNADPLRDSVLIAPRIGGELEETTARRIIGIVGDVRQYQLRSEPRAAIYVPVGQLPDRQAAFLARMGTSMTWIIRTRGEPQLLVDVIQQEVWAASGSAAVRPRSMDELSAASMSHEALEMWLSGVFGAVPLLLAAGGLYGVMSYSVEQRRREIGIRMALGAERAQLRGMVLTEAMKITSIGIVVGVAGALGLSRFMAALLFGIGPYDGTSFVAVPLVLGAVSLAAAWLPARSASAVDPMIALRAESHGRA